MIFSCILNTCLLHIVLILWGEIVLVTLRSQSVEEVKHKPCKTKKYIDVVSQGSWSQFAAPLVTFLFGNSFKMMVGFYNQKYFNGLNSLYSSFLVFSPQIINVNNQSAFISAYHVTNFAMINSLILLREQQYILRLKSHWNHLNSASGKDALYTWPINVVKV